MKQLVCPISDERINEKVTRLNALLTVVFVVFGFAFNSIYPFAFLLADYFIRAFTKSNFSPISYASTTMTNALNLQYKSTDKAPKIFAARLGFIMTLSVTVLLLLNLTTAAFVIGGILVFFALLEFTFAFCMGCILYTYIILPFYK